MCVAPRGAGASLLRAPCTEEHEPCETPRPVLQRVAAIRSRVVRRASLPVPEARSLTESDEDHSFCGTARRAVGCSTLPLVFRLVAARADAAGVTSAQRAADARHGSCARGRPRHRRLPPPRPRHAVAAAPAPARDGSDAAVPTDGGGNLPECASATVSSAKRVALAAASASSTCSTPRAAPPASSGSASRAEFFSAGFLCTHAANPCPRPARAARPSRATR